MARNFYIDNINDNDKLNEVSLLLNEMEEVSRIKIGKTGISFYCEDPENVQAVLNNHDENLVLKEEINSRKREFVAPEQKVEHIFMFTNLETEEEAKEIEEVISRYSAYENVSLDFTNKLLKVTTSQKNILVRLNRLVDKVNPKIDVEQWKKPFKSQDIFQQKYLNTMIRIAGLFVALALGLVTKDDPNFITNIAWLIALIIFNEKTLVQAYKDLKVKQFLSENITINLACLFGWVYGAYIEAIVVSLIYQVGERLLMRLINLTMEKIDDEINPIQLGRREIGENEYEMVSLEDFDIGDVIVVLPGETIPLGGKIASGESELDMFAINGSDILEPVKAGSEVQSGSVNVKDTLKIKILYTYDRSAMSRVLEIATMAPVGSSRTHRLVELISKIDTVLLVVAGIICATLVPILNFEANFKYIYLGAILCRTVIYARFDGVEVTEEEMELFAKLSKLHVGLIIFNDGPVDLENDQYRIYNNLTVDEKLEVMDKASIAGPVAYIGDNSKDIALLQKAYVGISRGGIKDKKVIENSDIMLMNSDLNTVIETFMISKKQKYITIENIFVGLFINVILMILAVLFIIPWWLALVIYLIEVVVVLFNTHRIIDMK